MIVLSRYDSGYELYRSRYWWRREMWQRRRANRRLRDSAQRVVGVDFAGDCSLLTELWMSRHDDGGIQIFEMTQR